jgi:hypothetical protein
MNRYKFIGKGLAVMAVALLMWGCGKSNNDAPAFNDTTGEHPSNWQSIHGTAYIAGPDSCTECHGNDLLGGISKVSCNKCHTWPINPHPAGWSAPAQHGAAAKGQPGTMTGFARCQACHGSDFEGGFTGVSCFGCHKPGPPLVKVPHAEAPWFNLTGTDVTHTNTDQANAAVCANCHRNPNTNGTPGCFNNTLCHGVVGAAHTFPYSGSVHGPVADPLGPTFTACLACHTNNPANAGAYPVAAGTPPDCRGCHIKGSPENGCGSCHGTDANGGRPDGTTFPDVAGRHNIGDHQFGCDNCHGTAGSGQTTHGPSNRNAHGDANVVLVPFVEAGYTRSGNGHGTCNDVGCHSSTRTW